MHGGWLCMMHAAVVADHPRVLPIRRFWFGRLVHVISSCIVLKHRNLATLFKLFSFKPRLLIPCWRSPADYLLICNPYVLVDVWTGLDNTRRTCLRGFHQIFGEFDQVWARFILQSISRDSRRAFRAALLRRVVLRTLWAWISTDGFERFVGILALFPPVGRFLQLAGRRLQLSCRRLQLGYRRYEYEWELLLGLPHSS
jgi:hypothetical protein